jgi:REP element-mobilizing transposase RayT
VGRLARENQPDCVYHLTARGIAERSVFADDVDRQGFGIRLRRVAVLASWRLHAVCLMDTHYHLVLQAPRGEIPEGMRTLNGSYARAFNARHGRRGSLFEQRYSDTPIRDEEHLADTVRYVWANPVRAGIVEQIEDWPWSTWDGSPLSNLLARCLTP